MWLGLRMFISFRCLKKHGNSIPITAYAVFGISRLNWNSTRVITQWKIAQRKAVGIVIIAFGPAFPSLVVPLFAWMRRMLVLFINRLHATSGRGGNYATQPRHAGINWAGLSYFSSLSGAAAICGLLWILPESTGTKALRNTSLRAIPYSLINAGIVVQTWSAKQRWGSLFSSSFTGVCCAGAIWQYSRSIFSTAYQPCQ